MIANKVLINRNPLGILHSANAVIAESIPVHIMWSISNPGAIDNRSRDSVQLASSLCASTDINSSQQCKTD